MIVWPPLGEREAAERAHAASERPQRERAERLDAMRQKPSPGDSHLVGFVQVLAPRALGSREFAAAVAAQAAVAVFRPVEL